MTRIRHSLIACAALLALSPAAAAATSPWSAPAAVPGETGTASIPEFSVPSFAFAFGTPSLGLITTLSKQAWLGSAVAGDHAQAARAISPSLRIDHLALYSKRGIVAVGEDRHNRLSVGFGTIGGTIGHVRPVVRERGRRVVALGVNANGRAAIAFAGNRHLYLTLGSRRRRFSRPVRLSGSSRVLGAVVRVNGHGDALAVWLAGGQEPRCRCRPGRHEAVARILTGHGHLLPVHRIGPAFTLPDVAFTRERRALVGWEDETAADVARVAYASDGGHFHHYQVLESTRHVNTEAREPSHIRVAVTAHGRAVVAWTGGSGTSRAIRVAESASGRFGAPQTLSSAGTDSNLDSLATGHSGEVVVSWTSEPDGPAQSVFASAQAAGESFGPPELVAPAGAASQVGIDPVTGVPLAAFYTDGGIYYSTRSPIR